MSTKRIAHHDSDLGLCADFALSCSRCAVPACEEEDTAADDDDVEESRLMRTERWMCPDNFWGFCLRYSIASKTCT